MRTIYIQMEPFCSKVSRNPWSDPRAEEEEPDCVETRSTKHNPAQWGGRRESQVLTFYIFKNFTFLVEILFSPRCLILNFADI